MFRVLSLFILALGLFVIAPPTQAASNPRTSARFQSLLEQHAKAAMRLDAFQAPFYEVEADFPKFGDALTPAALARPARLYRKTLRRLSRIDVNELTEAEKWTYELLKGDVQLKLEGQRHPMHFLDFNQMSNRLKSYIDSSSPAISQFPFDSVEHYQAYVSRSRGLPSYVRRLIRTFRDGAGRGYVLNCGIANRTLVTFQAALEPDVLRNPFFRPVLSFPSQFTKSQKRVLTRQFSEMIQNRIIPSYRLFDNFFRNEYLPLCRTTFGYSDLPNGSEIYKYLIQMRTDLPLDPNDVHNLGLAEVARIHGEIERVARAMGFNGSRSEFMRWMATEDQFRFQTKEALLASLEGARARIEPHLPQLFSVLPTTPYRIVESENPNAVGASYWGPTERQPYGRFVYNALNPTATRVFDITTLSIHEAVPGHHFQFAIQFENRAQTSLFQSKVFMSNAFAEGWALYAETLGDTIGVFSDPVQKFGNLDYEMLRAVRLVVDTGIHALGWTREQAIQYMTQNLAKDPVYIEGEIDRYSVWPGQALAYKIGQLKILELRSLAEQQLGNRFSLADFNSMVLEAGGVSLPVLEGRVRAWIASR